MGTYITANFTLEELIASDYAVRNGIDNTPPPDVLFNLRYLAVRLEQCRVVLNRPIKINSGYRCAQLNRGVGGAANSAHMHGLAADIDVPGMDPYNVVLELRPFVPFLKVDQLIYEGTWTHFGICIGTPPRGQILTAKFTKQGVSYTDFA
jgi:hypothetical protein